MLRTNDMPYIWNTQKGNDIMKTCKGNNALLRILTLALAIIIMISTTGCAMLQATEPIQPASRPTTPPTEQNNTITVSGTVESAQSRNVYSSLGLTIDEVNVEIGDKVTEGQVLVVLDTEDLELTIAQARAQLEITRQGAQINIDSSEVMLNQASDNVRANNNMHVVSAQAALSSAEANIRMIQASISAAQAELEAAQEAGTQDNAAMVLAASSAVTSAEMARSNREQDLYNAQILYEIGAISRFELNQAQDAFTTAENMLNDAQTNLDIANDSNARIIDSHQRALDSQRRSIEQLRTSLEAANAAHRQAQNALSAAQNAANQELDLLRNNLEASEIYANLEAQEIALQILERRLEDATITAPISGTITQSLAREGMIGSGLLFTIEDTEDLRVITRFREYDIGLITEGTEMTITAEMLGSETYNGTITRINPAAVSNMGIPSNIVEFETEVTVTSLDTNLRIGMNVRLSLELEG